MKLAFVFPGQGSQYVGMGQALAQAYPAARGALDEADAALGGGLLRLMSDGPEEELRKTANTQPAILAVSVAVHRVLVKEAGGKFQFPAFHAGHSLGEYSALVASGVLTLPDAARLVRFRAQAMQEAVPVGTGAMAAILGMDAQRVIEGCAEAVRSFGASTAEIVEAVNFNDPAQTVIAGSKKAVEKACEVLKASGAKRALPLPVSAPFHSSLMKPAAERLKERLAVTPFATPRIPVINNIEVKVEAEPDRIRAALFQQAFGPVRWVECVQAIKARGIDTLVECGPGKVLAG
ncbi:MAG: ACP S-malonyltransferase, partial [Myxococcales bacterium]